MNSVQYANEYQNTNPDLLPSQGQTPSADPSFRMMSRKDRRFPGMLLLIPVVLVLVLIMLTMGYYIYIHKVRTECERATRTIFEHARSLDFSDIDPAFLPEELQKNPNIRESLEEEIRNMIRKSKLGGLVDADIIDIDPLIDWIIEDAQYKITDVSAQWNQCTVTVEVRNLDFTKLPSSLYEEMQSEMTDPSSPIWQKVFRSIKELFGGQEEENEEEEPAPNWAEVLKEYYKNSKEKVMKEKTVGTITYGFDGYKITDWKIKDFDKNLISGFYGIEIPEELLNKYVK